MTNKPMLSAELLPCPFCGAPAKLEDHRLIWCVRCTKCSASILGDRAPEPHGDGVSSDEIQDIQAAAMSDSTDWAAYEKSTVDAWNSRNKPAAQHQGDNIGLAVDAAMIEMANISPPMRRSECERLIRAAMSTQQQPAPVAVVMPGRMNLRSSDGLETYETKSWNAALDSVARLNGITQ